MRMKKKKSAAGIVVAIVMVLMILSLTLLDVALAMKYRDESLKRNKTPHNAKLVDVTEPADSAPEIGRIYYSPIEEEHIVETEDEKYIDNELLIVVNDGVTRDQVAALAAAYNAEIVGEIEITGDYQLRLSTASDEELNAAVGGIGNDPIVRSVSLNYVAEMSPCAADKCGDFYYGKKWKSDLKNFNDAKGKSWGFEAISTIGAWNELNNHKSFVDPVKVGIIDAGFDPNHEDLGFAEYFYENGANGVKSGSTDHGTHVAGTFAADADDTTGICGVYPYGNGRLYGVSYIGVSKYGENGTFWTSSMWEKIALAELIIRDVKVINQSLGFNYYLNKFTDGLGNTDYYGLRAFWNNESNHKDKEKYASEIGDFLNRMLEKGYDFVIVSAAGNDSDPSIGHLESKFSSPLNLIEQSEYPDVYDRIIVVGSVSKDFKVSDFSNGGTRLDIYAPGEYIFSTTNGTYQNEFYSDGKWYPWSGTSMASPHVAGVAAMVWSANNSLSGAQVKEAITSQRTTRCASCNMVSAYLSVCKAFGEERKELDPETENGAVMCYVVDKRNDKIKVVDADVVMTDKSTGKEYTTVTDSHGHFEFMLPEGKYTISVKAEGYEDYSGSLLDKTIKVTAKGVNYVDWIKMKRAKGSKLDIGLLKEGEIHTGKDLADYLNSKYDDYDYGVPLRRVASWTYYDGHLYAVFDYAVSAKFMSLVTQMDPTVHLVTISDSGEQEIVEKLIELGERDVYYTGELVDTSGSLYAINSDTTSYSKWLEGCPSNYNKSGYDDVVVVYRGGKDTPVTDASYGRWMETSENEDHYIDFFDTDVDGVTRGAIIEWDLS